LDKINQSVFTVEQHLNHLKFLQKWAWPITEASPLRNPAHTSGIP
jgi:hypothetical protein